MSKIQIPGRPVEEILQASPDVQRYIRKLERDTMTDPLTHLGNRRAFELYANELLPLLPVDEHDRRKPGLRDLGLMIADVNGFKPVNDLLGHSAGDIMLKKAADAMRKGARRGADRACRIGGDELALLLPNADGALPGIVDLVQLYFLERVAKERKTVPDLDLAIGFVVIERYVPFKEFYDAADASMYSNKKAMAGSEYHGRRTHAR